MRRFKALLATMLLTGALGVLSGSAAAEPITVPGNPLTVYADALGQCQSSYLIQGEPAGNFFPGGGQYTFSATGDCGFFIATPAQPTSGLNPQPLDLRGTSEAGIVFGFNGHAGPSINTEYVPVSNGPLSGNGSPATPYKVVTVYDVVDSTENEAETGKNPVLQVTQTTTYVNGNPFFDADFEVKNVTNLLPHSGPHADPDYNKTIYYRALYAGDLYVNGNDHGRGVFLAGPPRFVGGQNQTSGVLGGFQEAAQNTTGAPVPAWSSFSEDYWATIWKGVQESANAPSAFPGTVSTEDVDDGAGVAWDTNYTEGHGLEPGASQQYAIANITTIPSTLLVNPTGQSLTQGATATITVTALNSGGQPFAETPLRYTIGGVNPQSGVVNTNAQGVAQIHYTGANPGVDLVSMYLDLGNSGTQVAADPTGAAQVTWVPAPPPPPNSSVTVQSVKVNSDGSITITYVPSEPGTGTLTVTVPTASIAKHHKAKKCKPGTVKIGGRCLPRTSVVGTASGPGTPGVPLSLTVKPSGKVLAALRKGRHLHVLADLTYQSSRGGAPSTHVYNLTLKGKKAKHKRRRHH